MDSGRSRVFVATRKKGLMWRLGNSYRDYNTEVIEKISLRVQKFGYPCMDGNGCRQGSLYELKKDGLD